jgi:hypothetical protein
MTKNMTRKGLALGAAFALVSSAVVATPALAAPGITLSPDKGTSYSFISGEQFNLKVFGNAEFTTGFANLRWEITNADAESIQWATNDAAGTAYNALSAAATTATITVTPVAGDIQTTAGGNKLGLQVAANNTATVKVRPYIELDGTAGFTSGDLGGNQETITFVEAKDVVATVSVTAPTAGDTTVTASFATNVNNESLAQGDFAIYFTTGTGADLAGAAASGTGPVTSTVLVAPAAWDATAKFKATTGAVTALVKDTAVKAVVLYNDGGAEDTTAGLPIASTNNVALVGSATAAVVERKAATIVGDAVASTSAKVITAGSAGDALLNSSFQAKVVVKDGATTPAGVANAAVTATITSAGLSATAGSEKTLTVNGTTFSNSSLLPGQGSVAKLALTTNASGEAVINFTTAGYAAGDTITVAFGTENLTSANLVLTQRAATYTATVRSFFTTTDGAAVAVPVVVYDQFGGVPADKYDVRATFDATNTGYAAQATAASTSGSSTLTPLVGGKATLSITDNGTGLGVNSYDVTVQERLAGNNYGSTITTAAEVNVHVLAAASLVAATVTSNGTQNATTKVYEIAGPVALSLVTPTAYDSVTVLGAAPTAYTGALTAQNITGTVSTVANATTAAAAVPGAQVTLSGAGLVFNDNGTGRYTVDSITVTANTSGVYSVNVYSNKAGKQTVSITSGAATATTTVVFAQAKDDTGAALVITAPDNVLPGSTLAVTVALTDKYGNKVTTDSTATNFNDGTTAPTFSLSSNSPGFQIGSNPTVTDKDGSAKLAYFLGVNDSGTITVTATYDADGAGTAKTAVTVTKTITIGAAVTKVAAFTKRAGDKIQIVSQGSAKVRFMLNGKRVATRSSLGTLNRTFDLVDGKNVIEIYVDGKRVLRRAATK